MSTSLAVLLPNGVIATVEAAPQEPQEEMIASVVPSIEGVMSVIEGTAMALHAAIKRARPSKASVTFGIELKVEAGALTGLIVKGEGKGNFAVTLEWSHLGPDE